MKLKGDLDNQYQEWQEKIESRDVNPYDLLVAYVNRMLIENRIESHQNNLNLEMQTDDENVKQELIVLLEELDHFKVQLNERYQNFVDFVNDIVNKDDGLSSQRIQQFEQFTADKSFVGDQCAICMADIEISRKMMRLNCNGQHTFCQA